MADSKKKSHISESGASKIHFDRKNKRKRFAYIPLRDNGADCGADDVGIMKNPFFILEFSGEGKMEKRHLPPSCQNRLQQIGSIDLQNIAWGREGVDVCLFKFI